MTKENSNIFLAGGNALVYLAKPMHKKCSKTYFWRHPFVRTYLMTDFSNPPPPPCTYMYTFRVTLFCVREVTNLTLSSPILTLLVFHSFLILFHLRNSRSLATQMQKRANLGELLRWLLRFLLKFWVLVKKLPQ